MSLEDRAWETSQKRVTAGGKHQRELKSSEYNKTHADLIIVDSLIHSDKQKEAKNCNTAARRQAEG